MYRLKNEERWIQKSIESIYDICSEIVVLDDGSTDRTVEICSGFDKVVDIYHQENLPLDETRDRNRLLQMALKRKPDFLLTFDGDEVFMPKPHEILFEELNILYPKADVFEFQFFTLWDAPNQIRYDGIFGNYWQRRLHNMKDQPDNLFYRNSPYQGNLHCSALNNFKEDNVVRSNVKIFHLASFSEELRQKKYEFYTKIDPNNTFTEEYIHMISGKGKLSGPNGIRLWKLPKEMIPDLSTLNSS